MSFQQSRAVVDPCSLHAKYQPLGKGSCALHNGPCRLQETLPSSSHSTPSPSSRKPASWSRECPLAQDSKNQVGVERLWVPAHSSPRKCGRTRNRLNGVEERLVCVFFSTAEDMDQFGLPLGSMPRVVSSSPILATADSPVPLPEYWVSTLMPWSRCVGAHAATTCPTSKRSAV